MRINLILLAVVVLLGIGLSFLLIPREKDVALLQLSSQDTDLAGRETLLQRYREGDRSVQVIAPLADLALNLGEIDDAITLLEDYLARNPNDVAARRRLAEYYRFDQRRDEFVAALAEIVARAGTPQERRQLVDLYRARGDYERLLPALTELVDRGLAKPADYMEAAELAASSGSLDQALAILEAMWRVHPSSLEARSVRLYVLAAAAAGETARAQEVVARMAQTNGTAAIVPVIRGIADRGQAAFGLRLLESFEENLHLTPPLLVAWADMQRALDREQVALQKLLELERRGELPSLAVPVLLDLALLAEDIDLLERLLKDRDLTGIVDFRLAAIGDAAVAWRRNALLEQIRAQASESFRRGYPALLAEVLLGIGMPEAARAEVARARATDDLRARQLIRLARAEFRLGEDEAAARTLERIATARDLDEDSVRALAGLYLSTERTRAGLRAFERLRRERPSPAAEAGWARMAAREGQDSVLLDWLQANTVADRDLLADIVFLSQPGLAPRSALAAAERLYREHPDREARRLYGDALIANGRAAEAVPVLEELLPGTAEDAGSYVAALVAADRKIEALAWLRSRAEEDTLPVLIADDYMALAIELDQPKLAYAEARRQDLRKFDDDTIASLAENAAVDGDFALVDEIVAEVGAQFMAARPVMAARVELARGDEAAAREWAEKAAARPDLRNADRLDLARVWSLLGENERSLALLESLAEDSATPAFAIADLAAQYLELGKAKQGLPVFRRLIERRREPQVLEGWARLEARAGEPARVLDWLRGADTVSRQALADIYYLAQERGAATTAFTAAERLFEAYPGDEARLIWGRALTDAGQAGEAVTVLRPLLPGDREVRSAYVAALGRGGNAEALKAFARTALDDPDLDPEVRSALLFALLEGGAADIALPILRDLAEGDPKQWEAAYLDALRQTQSDEERARVLMSKLDGDPPPAQRDPLLFELLEVGGPAKALPYLKTAAAGDPLGTWPSAYEAALSDLGRRPELVEWLERRARLPELPRQQRREAAFRLLDLEAKPEAVASFRRLAEDRPPSSPDVQQLLFLWGPRPPEAGVDWLEQRARAAAGDDRAEWLQFLNNAGAPGRVVAIAADPPPGRPDDPTLAPLIRALVTERRFDRVGQILSPLVARADDGKTLLRLADWAEQADQGRVAVAAYDRALGMIGDDPAALLRAGRAFTFQGRAEKAVQTLERYFAVADAKGRADHRPWYYYAQSLSLMDRQEAARGAYREMLSRIEAGDANDFESRRMRATGLEALGRTEDAIALYEQLRAERPRDRSLLADFVSLLIETGAYERADRLLREN